MSNDVNWSRYGQIRQQWMKRCVHVEHRWCILESVRSLVFSIRRIWSRGTWRVHLFVNAASYFDDWSWKIPCSPPEMGNSGLFHSTPVELGRSCERKIGVTTLCINERYQSGLQLRRLLRSYIKNSLLLWELTPEFPISVHHRILAGILENSWSLTKSYLMSEETLPDKPSDDVFHFAVEILMLSFLEVRSSHVTQHFNLLRLSTRCHPMHRSMVSQQEVTLPTSSIHLHDESLPLPGSIEQSHDNHRPRVFFADFNKIEFVEDKKDNT